jgi:hypothetical protein
MAIKVGGTVVIDDSRNFSNVGIITVGSGSSSVTIESDSNFMIGIGATINGNDGNISIAGTITAKALSIPLSLG